VILLERLLLSIAMIALLAMMAVMTTDALGRYIFSSPLSAGFELIQILMAILVFSAIPIVTLRRSHVVVDIFDFLLSSRTRRVLSIITTSVCLIISLTFAWVLWRRGAFLAAGNEVTANLGVPQAPLAYGMAFTWVICALAFVRVLTQVWRSNDASAAPESGVGDQ
jgi:TRAP-type C4-dicarboxylate transport system permease small subunit